MIGSNAKVYWKTPTQALLNRQRIDSLRDYIELPSTVKDAKPLLVMFIECNPQLQSANPETVLNNLVQFALAYNQFTHGKKLDLTLSRNVAIPMPPPYEEPEEKPFFQESLKSPKSPPKIEEVEVDEEMEAELLALRKKLLIAKKKKALEAELKAIEDE
jgi:hypothetical protein